MNLKHKDREIFWDREKYFVNDRELVGYHSEDICEMNKKVSKCQMGFERNLVKF